MGFRVFYSSSHRHGTANMLRTETRKIPVMGDQDAKLNRNIGAVTATSGSSSSSRRRRSRTSRRRSSSSRKRRRISDSMSEYYYILY